MIRFRRAESTAIQQGGDVPPAQSGRRSGPFRQVSRAMTVATPVLLSAMAFVPLPGMAGANLVKNGNFESSTGAGSYGVTGGISGLGQVNNANTTNFVQIGGLSSLGGGGWQVTCILNCDASNTNNQGYAFLLNQDADTVGANAGFPSYAQNTIKIMNLWGPNIAYPGGWPAGVQYVPPTPSVSNLGSPQGGKFLAIDGVYGRSKITQQLTGLDTTKTYTLSFEYAGGQQYSRNESGKYQGATDQTWIVRGTGGFSDFSLGSQSCAGGTLTCWVNPSQSFTPWQTYTKTFTPTSSTLDLEFEAWGTTAGQATPTGDNPPFLLLDNVQLRQNDPVPAPLPVIGGAVALTVSRRLRRRLAAGKSDASPARVN